MGQPGTSPARFSVSLIIPKTDTATIEKINKAIRAAYEEGQSKLKGTSKYMPDLEDLKLPLRDGDKERKGDPTYAGCIRKDTAATAKRSETSILVRTVVR